MVKVVEEVDILEYIQEFLVTQNGYLVENKISIKKNIFPKYYLI